MEVACRLVFVKWLSVYLRDVQDGTFRCLNGKYSKFMVGEGVNMRTIS